MARTLSNDGEDLDSLLQRILALSFILSSIHAPPGAVHTHRKIARQIHPIIRRSPDTTRMKPDCPSLLQMSGWMFHPFRHGDTQREVCTTAVLNENERPWFAAVEIMSKGLPIDTASPSDSAVHWTLAREHGDYGAFQSQLDTCIERCVADSPETLVRNIVGMLAHGPIGIESIAPKVAWDAWSRRIVKYILRNNLADLAETVLAVQNVFALPVVEILRGWVGGMSGEAEPTERRLVALPPSVVNYIQIQAARSEASGRSDASANWSAMLEQRDGVSAVGVFAPQTYVNWVKMLANLLDVIYRALFTILHLSRDTSYLSCDLAIGWKGRVVIEAWLTTGVFLGEPPIGSLSSGDIRMRDAFLFLSTHLELLYAMVHWKADFTMPGVQTFCVFEELLCNGSIGLNHYLQVHIPSRRHRRYAPLWEHLKELCFWSHVGSTLAGAYKRLPAEVRQRSLGYILLTGQWNSQSRHRLSVEHRSEIIMRLSARANLSDTETLSLSRFVEGCGGGPVGSYIHPLSVLSAMSALEPATILCPRGCSHYDGRCNLYRELREDTEALNAIQRYPRWQSSTHSRCAICRWVRLPSDRRPATCDPLGYFYPCVPFGLSGTDAKALATALENTCVRYLQHAEWAYEGEP